MSSFTTITGLGRSIDPRLQSHRVAIGGALTAGAAYAAIAAATDQALSDALIAAVVVFLAWANGRELDPDRPLVGVWAMPLVFAASIYDLPSALVSAVALIAIRVVAGTVGSAVTWVDIVALVLLGFLSGSEPVLWIVGLTLTIWVMTAPEVGPLRYVGLGALAVGVGVGAWLAESSIAEVTQDAYLLAAVGGAVMMLAMRPSTMISTTDAHTGPVDPTRVGLARKAAGTFIMWAAVMGGVAGFWMVSPILAALMSTAFAKWFSAGA
jgi:hypothetical protein